MPTEGADRARGAPDGGLQVDSQRLLTIERGIGFLERLAKDGPMAVSGLAQASGLPASTVYRYVAALRESGMIWDLPGGQLGLGPRCVQLELGFREALDTWVPCQPVMRELAAVTGETVALLVPLGCEAVCIDTVLSPQTLRYSFERGMTTPLVRGAAGKAMLAHFEPSRQQAMVAASPLLQDDERAPLLEELSIIRRRGTAVSREELDRGAWAAAVPVFDVAGAVEGTLCVIAPTVRAEGRETFLIGATKEAGGRLPSIKGWGAAAPV